MKEKEDVINIHFRYLSLSKEQSIIVINNLTTQKIDHEVNESKGLYIIMIYDIDKRSFNADFINKLNGELQLDKSKYDFFISITSSRQMGGFSIPSSIVEYIKTVGGKSIEISYVIL